MDTGVAPAASSGRRIRWRPVGSWGLGGAWSYRSPRIVNPLGVVLFAFLAAMYTVEWLATSFTLEWFGEGSNSNGWLTGGTIVLALYWLTLGLGLCLMRTYVDVDTHGITVVNGLRTHRVRWSDIDLVQIQGRPAITLLTKDRRITCWGLHQGFGDLLPWSRHGRRNELAANADWIRALAAASPQTAERR